MPQNIDIAAALMKTGSILPGQPNWKIFRFEETGVSVSTATTTLVSFTNADVLLSGFMGFELDNNTGGQALNSLNLQGKMHSNAAWFTYIGGTSWVEDTNNVLSLSGSPEDLASPAIANAQIALFAFQELRFTATVASSTTTVDIRGVITGRRT